MTKTTEFKDLQSRLRRAELRRLYDRLRPLVGGHSESELLQNALHLLTKCTAAAAIAGATATATASAQATAGAQATARPAGRRRARSKSRVT